MDAIELIAAIRRSGQLPTNDPSYTDAVILEEATQALIERFMEPVTALRQGYWLQRSTITADPANTSGLYRLPARAVVQGVELIEISTNGGANYHPISLLTQTQSVGLNDNTQGTPHSYVLEGDCVRLLPAPNMALLIRFRYYLRPPELITSVGPVCSVVSQPTANVIVVNTDPASEGISTSTGLDIQDADGSHEVVVVGAAITSITGAGPFTITLSDSSIFTGRVSVGDLVRAPDQAALPMLVRELHRPLADYVAGVIRASKGDKDKSALLTQKAQNGIDRVVSAAQPRVKNSPFVFRRNSYLRRNVGWGGGR